MAIYCRSATRAAPADTPLIGAAGVFLQETAGGGPGRLPGGGTVPVEGYSAQEVTAGQRCGGSCGGGDRGEQRVEDHVALTR